MVEEEVAMEVEAVRAVYGDDCVVLDPYPPHLHLHIKPRTADVSSEQFVEAVIGIRAGPKYPEEPPHISLIESKGLDRQRQKHLICSIREKASELSSYLMLIALCEESVEKLSIMNHPDGDCPLCLYPLVPTDNDKIKPFMKLMSCFHCFHSECIIRWWNWLQTEKEVEAKSSSSASMRSGRDTRNQQDMHRAEEENMGMCPVCRKVFQAKDLEHVLNLVGSQSSLQISDGNAAVDVNKELLQSDSENLRRQKFEAILKLQQERSGLIEPKKDLVVVPGMFLPQPTTFTNETSEHGQKELPARAEVNSCGSSKRPNTSKHRNSGARKERVRNPQKQVRQWVRKDNSTAD